MFIRTKSNFVHFVTKEFTKFFTEQFIIILLTKKYIHIYSKNKRLMRSSGGHLKTTLKVKTYDTEL